MTFAAAPKRLACPRCLRPQSACICQWITPVSNRVEVLILQHPLETQQAKGSARLLHLSLRRSHLYTGEAFAETELRALLQQPLPPLSHQPSHEPRSTRPLHTVLLYPADAADGGMPLPRSALAEPQRLRLIVLDGTWRKSRKMLYLNPLLQHLPRLPLTAPPTSRYRIRQAHKPGQLSTLEAVCQALTDIEGESEGSAAGEKYHPLLRAFDGFVAQQLAYLGPAPALEGAAGTPL